MNCLVSKRNKQINQNHLHKLLWVRSERATADLSLELERGLQDLLTLSHHAKATCVSLDLIEKNGPKTLKRGCVPAF
jgi:hypothetical protein